MKGRALTSVFILLTMVGIALGAAGCARYLDAQSTTSNYLPLIMRAGSTAPAQEWSQHAHDAQRTSYNPQAVPPPWRWRWAWNGPNSSGGIGKVTSNGSLPRNVQPVTGGGRVYVAAGTDGVFALGESNGQQLWQRSNIGDVRSTVAYDHETGSVFVVSANGRLYQLRATDGEILNQFNSGQSSNLPLPPAVINGRVFFSMGNRVYAIDKQTMQPIWVYQAGATVATPPAYSPSRNAVIVATEPDLYVHAIHNTDGTQKWRVRPVDPSRNFTDPTEFRNGWPVIAESAGYVLIKVRLDWQTIWRDWPQTNSAMRQLLSENPGEQALFVMDLDDGSIPFMANVGNGGYGDSGYLPMGPQPVVKRLASGKEVVYTIIRATHVYDARWDSHFGEMMLDSSTVSGLQGGDVRFIAFDYPPGDENPFLLTDEQPNVAMAGDYLFGGHWEAGFALQILDRSDARGSFSNKITSQRLATIVTSQDTGACPFSASHYCASGLENTRYYDFGFYIYYNQGAVYDQYWSEYATWVVSNDNVYFRSTDGAIVALTSGSPTNVAETAVATPLPHPIADAAPIATIPYDEAHAWNGRTVTVTGTLRYIFNNGKQVLLGFANPHQGSFKAIIRQEDWPHFAAPPEQLYRAGQQVAVTGTMAWYQGDPAIYLTAPDEIRVTGTETGSETAVYLPLLLQESCAAETLPRINAPGFSGNVPFSRTAIAWFGQVSPTQNYADIRVGYNATDLYVYLAIFDRHLWYDVNPSPATLTQWDAVTLLLDTGSGHSLSPTSWKFVAQLYGEPSAARRAVYRGGVNGWQSVSVPFQAVPGWRGNALNNNSQSDRGWAMGFTIPFSSLGLMATPPTGTTWRTAVILHDRDTQAGPPIGDQVWPLPATPETPTCWGFLNFGLPTYQSNATPSGSLLIRRPTQNSPLVPDADVGGTTSNQCPGDETHIWNEWGNRNYGRSPDFNIQNQSDVADWPCFAKYYITFPLGGIPPGKEIISATLTLHQFGNAGGAGQAQPSWIQVLIASGDWQETGITWNNAPLAHENVGGSWVGVISDWPGWPGVPRTWDVSYAVARAYARGEPLRLILYEADAAYHSGKYFVSSDTGDWNLAGRPRLEVWWGERE